LRMEAVNDLQSIRSLLIVSALINLRSAVESVREEG